MSIVLIYRVLRIIVFRQEEGERLVAEMKERFAATIAHTHQQMLPSNEGIPEAVRIEYKYDSHTYQ